MQNMPVIGRMSSNNQLIEGQFINNQSNGQTRIINLDGYYLGNKKSNMKNGKGLLSTKIGTYVGNWLNDKKSGDGKFTYAN